MPRKNYKEENSLCIFQIFLTHVVGCYYSGKNKKIKEEHKNRFFFANEKKFPKNNITILSIFNHLE